MKKLKNTTAAELQNVLGLEGPPILKTILVTALDKLSPAAKLDIVQFLTPVTENSPKYNWGPKVRKR